MIVKTLSFCLLIAVSFLLVSSKVIPASQNAAPAADLADKRELLRNMTKEAWNAYVKYGWGAETVRPLSSEPAWSLNNAGENGRTIVAAMSTLWVMGLKDEFERGRAWIESNFGNFSQVDDEIDVQLYINEYVGSLLSCYALTNDTMFRDKAFDIARILQPAYDNRTGLPSRTFIPKTGLRKSLTNVDLDDLGGTVLETRYLHALAPNQFPDRTNQWRNLLKTLSQSEPNQVFLDDIDLTTNAKWSGKVRSLTSYNTQPLYANLVKAYVQSNGNDLAGLDMYVKAIENAEQSQMITKSNKTGLTFIRDYQNDSSKFVNYMEYEACNFGAIFKLSSGSLENVLKSHRSIGSIGTNDKLNETINKHKTLANRITETCYYAANKTSTKLPLRGMYFTDKEEAENVQGLNELRNYLFDSGLEESYLVMWRTSKQNKYRDYAWELTQAIHRHARIGNGRGFGSVKDVNKLPSSKLDYQKPDILASVFKYLYLIFSEDNVLPLDQWVFTAAGHPLPICGKNKANLNC